MVSVIARDSISFPSARENPRKAFPFFRLRKLNSDCRKKGKTKCHNSIIVWSKSVLFTILCFFNQKKRIEYEFSVRPVSQFLSVNLSLSQNHYVKFFTLSIFHSVNRSFSQLFTWSIVHLVNDSLGQSFTK